MAALVRRRNCWVRLVWLRILLYSIRFALSRTYPGFRLQASGCRLF
jgi:hypothetical protein